MIKKHPSVKEMTKLWSICVAFIESNEIGCREHIEQCDGVIQDAYSLINDICDEVGYVEFEED